MKRQELLQWFGLLGAPLAWATQLVLGFGVTEARCGAVDARWGVGADTWELALMASAGAVVLLAEASAVALYVRTRGVDHSDPPPLGRQRFFVTASSLGNVLFLVMILMSGIAAVHDVPCVQS